MIVAFVILFSFSLTKCLNSLRVTNAISEYEFTRAACLDDVAFDISAQKFTGNLSLQLSSCLPSNGIQGGAHAFRNIGSLVQSLQAGLITVELWVQFNQSLDDNYGTLFTIQDPRRDHLHCINDMQVLL